MNGVMEKFERVQYVLPSLGEYVALHVELLKKAAVVADEAMAREQAIKEYQRLEQAEVYTNDQYQVALDRAPPHGFQGMRIWHLSIKRLDKEPLHDWRDLQEIKNQLAGRDMEAVEIFPDEARKVDAANQYHLWVFVAQNIKGKWEPLRLPLGFGQRLIIDKAEGLPTAQQRKLPTEAVDSPTK